MENNSRGRGTNCEEDPRQQQLGVNIVRLDEQEQGEADDGVASDGDVAHAYPVGHEAPDGTCDQSHDLIDEAEGADDVTHAIFNAYQVSDDEGDAAVEKHQERDAEQGYAEEVGYRLEGGRRCGEGEEADDATLPWWGCHLICV